VVYPQNPSRALSGKISRDTRWTGDVYINGDVTVQMGVVLYIEPGTHVYFAPHQDVTHGGNDEELSELTVLGTLVVRGKPADGKVLFSSEAKEPQIGDWYGIVLKNLNKPSVIKYAVVEYGYKGITCYGSSPQISFSEIRFNYYAGISCEVRSRPSIRNSIILGNEVAGINCELASYPLITGCTITQNGNGVIAFDRSNPDLGHWPPQGKLSRGLNRIYNNFDFDLYNHSSVNIYAQNNIWNSTSSLAIRRVLYDKEDNPVYGKIIFQPIFRKNTPALAARRPQNLTNLTKRDIKRSKTDSVQPRAKPPATKTDRVITDSLLFELLSSVSTQEDSLKEQLTLRKSSEPEENMPRKISGYVAEPVLEALLDDGIRKYVHREKPTYPYIYYKIGKTGTVIMEVVVGRDGKVKSTRVLRSDGDLFTKSALDAVRKFKYKPGTFRGKPVSFKVVERFKFTLER